AFPGDRRRLGTRRRPGRAGARRRGTDPACRPRDRAPGRTPGRGRAAGRLVSLYLKVGIGAGRYLLDAVRVLEIRSDAARGHWRGEDVAVVDCRELFDELVGQLGEGI